MAIKYVKLDAVSVTTDEATGVVTVTGTRDEKSIVSGLGDALLTPFKLNNDEAFVSESAAAQASILWGAVSFHVADYMHARNGSPAISPITGLFSN